MSAKFSDFTRGEEEALLNTIGGVDVARKIIDGELKFSITEDAAKIIVAVKKLFDKNGRRIVPRGLKAKVCDPDKNHHVEQPALHHKERIKERMSKGFEATGLIPNLSLDDFEARVDKLILTARYKTYSVYQNLFNGVYLPIIIPKTQLTDIGEMTEELVIAAGKSYKKHFAKRSFDYCKGELKNQVSITNGSRYEILVERIKKESVVGIYFPTTLQGYSVNADIEQMSSLPEGIILSGPLDSAMAFAMYPDVLGRNSDALVYDCAAVNWQSSEYSLFFRVYDDGATFRYGTHLFNADSNFSGGLLLID